MQRTKKESPRTQRTIDVVWASRFSAFEELLYSIISERSGGGGNRTSEKEKKGRLPKSIYSDPLLDTEPITISDRFQTPLFLSPLVPIPPPSSSMSTHGTVASLALKN